MSGFDENPNVRIVRTSSGETRLNAPSYEGHLKAIEVVSSAPAAGDLESGELVLGNGTAGDNSDEIFMSVDGSTVARFNSSSTIT